MKTCYKDGRRYHTTTINPLLSQYTRTSPWSRSYQSPNMGSSTMQAMALLLLTTSSVLAAAPTVHLGSATLIGREASVPQASPANAYLGIPFAEQPKRFMPPEPLLNFTGTHDVTGYKAACIQEGPGGFILPPDSLAEKFPTDYPQRYPRGTRKPPSIRS